MTRMVQSLLLIHRLVTHLTRATAIWIRPRQLEYISDCIQTIHKFRLKLASSIWIVVARLGDGTDPQHQQFGLSSRLTIDLISPVLMTDQDALRCILGIRRTS